MKIAVVAITRHGIALAGKVAAALPGAQLFAPEKFRAEAEAASSTAACYAGKTGDQIPALFEAFDGIVAVVSLGAVVRLIAPHLKSKDVDPAVVVLDEGGKFAIPILSGHLGGANALAGHLATAIGAQAVLTTAPTRAKRSASTSSAANSAGRLKPRTTNSSVAAPLSSTTNPSRWCRKPAAPTGGRSTPTAARDRSPPT